MMQSGPNGFTGPILVFLVTSWPWVLWQYPPLGFFGGIGGASRRGILVKGGNYLEALNHVETVVFDKAGTLTKGRYSRLLDIKPSPGFTEEELLEWAAYAEVYSITPFADSIRKPRRCGRRKRQLNTMKK